MPSLAAQLTEVLTTPSRFLIVEDHDLFANLMLRICREVGVDSVVAANAEDGLSKYRLVADHFTPTRQHRMPFDIVFVDARLPDRSGQSLVKEIREIVPDQFVILMSGYAIDHDPDLGLVGVWFKASGNPERMFRDIRRLCNTLQIPVESTPL